MKTVTDEMVEKACRAFVARWNGVVPDDDKFFDWDSLRTDMRAALEAAEVVRRDVIIYDDRRDADWEGW
jgi:hypothetical protein